MRMDYILYAVAILFFIVTLASFVYSLEWQQVWIVSTAVLGLAFVGFGYTQRPKTTSTPSTPKASEPSVSPLQQQQQQQVVVDTPAPPQPIVAVTPQATPQPVVTEPTKPPETEPIVEQPQPPQSTLTKVKGIGEKRATQLKGIGISGIEDLAEASPQELAAKLNISPKITRKWVENAKEIGQKP